MSNEKIWSQTKDQASSKLNTLQHLIELNMLSQMRHDTIDINSLVDKYTRVVNWIEEMEYLYG